MNSFVLNEYKMKRKMEDFALEKGYLPYEPFLFENYDNFSALTCEVKKEQLITVITGQKFHLLRPDITTTIMNNVLASLNKNESLKLFYQSTTYRLQDADPKAINQFGIEYLGIMDKDCERDVLSLAISYLQDVPFILEVGTMAFLNKILQLCKLDELQEKVFRKLVYIKNREELIKFTQINNLPQEVQQILHQLFTLRGTYEELQTKLQSFSIGSCLIDALDEVSYLKDFNHQVIIDLSMTSELTYYDGVIFKGYYRNIPQAVLSGGKYAVDKAINNNAIGFSIDVDSWLAAQKEDGSIWNI